MFPKLQVSGAHHLYAHWCHACLAVFASKLPQTQMEWAQLLEAQQRYHDAELQKWREIIKSSVVLLDQVKRSNFKESEPFLFM